MKNVNELAIYVSGQYVGQLNFLPSGAYEFRYAKNANPDLAVSLVMPVINPDGSRAGAYRSNCLHPIFQQNLPEGQLLATIRKRFSKTADLSPLGLLSIVGKHSLGRMQAVDGAIEPPSLYDTPNQNDVSVFDLTHRADSKALFAEMLSTFAASSGVSGSNAKFLFDSGDRAIMKTNRYVVKAAPVEYEGLAFNEFFCTSIAHAAGLQTPEEFTVDGSGDIFVSKRFDRDADGAPIAFEECCAMLGMVSDQRYDMAYDNIASLIQWFSSKPHDDMLLLFKSMALMTLTRNGDAHLKNFGMIYSGRGDVRLSPSYDLTCTTVYHTNDLPALRFGEDRMWPTEDELLSWGKRTCMLSNQEMRFAIRDVENAIASTMKVLVQVGNECPYPELSSHMIAEWTKAAAEFSPAFIDSLRADPDLHDYLFAIDSNDPLGQLPVSDEPGSTPIARPRG